MALVGYDDLRRCVEALAGIQVHEDMPDCPSQRPLARQGSTGNLVPTVSADDRNILDPIFSVASVIENVPIGRHHMRCPTVLRALLNELGTVEIDQQHGATNLSGISKSFCGQPKRIWSAYDGF